MLYPIIDKNQSMFVDDEILSQKEWDVLNDSIWVCNVLY